MKMIFKIVLLTLTVLAASSISFAQGINERESIVEETLFNDNEGVASERFSLYKEMREMNKGSRWKNNDVVNNAGMNIYNIPQPLVSSITYDFSNNGKRASAGRDFFEWPSKPTDALQIGAAFFTNLAAHEFGHDIVANNVGAEDSRVNFFKKSDGDFFLGTSTVSSIDQRSILPYAMGGEFFADLSFEHALQGYRNSPNPYNKSLLLISGTDFLWYCFYAFYVSNDNPSYDPITISKETGISRDMLFSVALAKTLVNAYRIYSGQDKVVPYFKVDRSSASLNFMIPLEIGS